MDNKDLNIYQKMDLVRVDVGAIAKNIKVSTSQGGGYKAVSESDVIKAVNEAEHKWGLVSYQEGLDIIESEKIDKIYKDTRTVYFRIRVRCIVRVVNIDNPSEFIYFIGLGDGIDSQDKATGKANTYALKYALMRGYKIPTGEDPDYFSSKEIKSVLEESQEQKQEFKSIESQLEKDIKESLINELKEEIKGAKFTEEKALKQWGFNSFEEMGIDLIKEKIENARKPKKSQMVKKEGELETREKEEK